MNFNLIRWVVVVSMVAVAGCGSGTSEDKSVTDVGGNDSSSADAGRDTASDLTDLPVTVRVAAFNASLFRGAMGELEADLEGGVDPQARRVAEVLQTVRPDIVLVSEFDWDAGAVSARIFAEQYLNVGQGGKQALNFEYRFVPSTNTGVPSGVDLNNSGAAVSEPGTQAYGDDAFGFGVFPGQYGMAVFSRFPIAANDVRSFQNLLWRDMPDALIPTDWYSAQAIEVLRLSSKNHVDVPVQVGAETLHLLVSHPTPPSFDGDEDRNGRRNHDEVRFWVDYITSGPRAAYITDDRGVEGGLDAEAKFVVLGDLNSDPFDGDSRNEALKALLAHPRVQDTSPSSAGAAKASESDGQANTSHAGDAALDTADFSDGRVGNLRVDYVLPSTNTVVVDSGVFWPAPGDVNADLADVSDHHLVWVDVRLNP